MSSGRLEPRRQGTSSTGYTLKVDPIACTAHGMCAELLPERIGVDDWGYPIVDRHDLSADLLELAEMAVEACPTLALRLERQARARQPRSR